VGVVGTVAFIENTARESWSFVSSQLLYRGPALDVLHEQYAEHGLTDRGAPVTAARSVQISAAPQRVWQVLSAAARWPAIQPTISDVHLPHGVAVDAAFSWTSGRSRFKSRFAVVDPERELT
jgi:hypothetical protein